MLVCHYFNRLSRPIFDRRIELDGQALAPPSSTLMELHRRLQDDPSRGDNCKEFYVTMIPPTFRRPIWETASDDEVEFILANELITMLPNVRCVKIGPGSYPSIPRLDTPTESFMQKLFQHCTRLEHIDLIVVHDPYIGRIIKDTSRSLKILEIMSFFSSTEDTQTKPEVRSGEEGVNKSR